MTNQNKKGYNAIYPRLMYCPYKNSLREWTGKQVIRNPPSTMVPLMTMVKRKERRVDALALRADERRDKLRKAAGRSKYPSIRRSPNVGTRQSKPLSSLRESIA